MLDHTGYLAVAELYVRLVEAERAGRTALILPRRMPVPAVDGLTFEPYRVPRKAQRGNSIGTGCLPFSKKRAESWNKRAYNSATAPE